VTAVATLLGIANRDWYQTPSVCPAKLRVIFNSGGPFGLVVNFAGRGKTGKGATGTVLCGVDSYVTTLPIPGASMIVDIDVWQAYRDGIWTSSTTILCYVLAGVFVAHDLQAYPLNSGNIESKNVTPVDSSGAMSCPVTLLATITVNDDGTWSIA
jgi:hypothetical protein